MSQCSNVRLDRDSDCDSSERPLLADVKDVTLIAIIAGLVGAWAILSVIGNERQDRLNRLQIEQRIAANNEKKAA